MPLSPFPRKLPLVAALAAGLLAGCSPVPLSTMAALHAFDLSTVEAKDLRLALRKPDVLVLDGGAPVLTVTVGIAGSAPERRDYVMSEVFSPTETAALSGLGRRDEAVTVYALDRRSARDLDAYLADLRRTAAPGDRQLSITLAIEGCRLTGPVGGPLPVTTFIRLAPGEPYRVLTRQRDLAAMARLAGFDAEIRLCE